MRMVKYINLDSTIFIEGLTFGKVYEIIDYIPCTKLPSNMDVISIFNDNGNLMQYYMGSVYDHNIFFFEDYTIGYRDDIIDGILQ